MKDTENKTMKFHNLTEHDKKKLAEDNAWRNENFERNTKKTKP